MNALTLMHPWPLAIARLGKDVENRTWSPPASLLRPGDWLALHGGAVPATVRARIEARGLLDELLRKHAADPARRRTLADACRGDGAFLTGIFAVARYAGAVTAHPGPWFFGPVGWTWTELVVLPGPVPCRGARKLWPLPADVLEQVRAGFRAAQPSVDP